MEESQKPHELHELQDPHAGQQSKSMNMTAHVTLTQAASSKQQGSGMHTACDRVAFRIINKVQVPGLHFRHGLLVVSSVQQVVQVIRYSSSQVVFDGSSW